MPENRHKTGFRGPSPEVGKSTQFKPGQSGNPGGRPKSRLQSEAYRTELAKEGREGKTKAEKIAERMVADAIRGKVDAAKHVAEYVEGKPRQAFEVKMSIMDELAERIAEGRKRAKR
jgi:hypothetical protein